MGNEVIKKDIFEEAINTANDDEVFGDLEKESKVKIADDVKKAVKDLYVSNKSYRKTLKELEKEKGTFKDIIEDLDLDVVVSDDTELKLSETSKRYRRSFMKLYSSKEEKKIIKVEIVGAEKISDYWVGVAYEGNFKIIIPSFEFFDITPTSARQKATNKQPEVVNLLKYRITSTVDIIVENIDIDNNIVLASRRKAMDIKKKLYYLTDFENGRIIKEGSVAEANVVSVSKGGIAVEVFGVEATLPASVLSHNYIADASKHFSNGDVVEVRITDLYVDKKGNVEFNASIKDVLEHKIKNLYEQMELGTLVVGQVTVIDGKNVFTKVKIGEGSIDILCKYPEFNIKPIVGSNVVVEITHKSDDLRFMGVIKYIA